MIKFTTAFFSCPGYFPREACQRRDEDYAHARRQTQESGLGKSRGGGVAVEFPQCLRPFRQVSHASGAAVMRIHDVKH